MDDIYLELVKALSEHQELCLCTLVETGGSVPRPAGAKMLVYPNGKTTGSVGGGALESEVIEEAFEAMRTGKTKFLDYSMNPNDKNAVGVCGGWAKVYIEPQLGRACLLILGAGHVGLSVAKIASLMDFRIVLTDDREDALKHINLPEGVEFIQSSISELPNKIRITPNTYIIGLSRDALLDIEGYPALLDTDFAYFGSIGSRNRWKYTRDSMIEAGVASEQIDRIKSPIGLYIKAVTPDEIAISILAEIIEHRNSK